MRSVIFIFLISGISTFGSLNKEDIRYLLEADYDTDESRKEFKSKVDLVSKEDVFQWTELVSSQDIPVTLSRILYIATIKYEYFSGVYTDDEKTRLARLIIRGVEKHIEKTGRYGELGDLYRVDHPFVDALIERLKPVKDEDCVYNLNILVLGIAETRSKKAGAVRSFAVQKFSAPTQSAVLPALIKAPGATAQESASANPVWFWWGLALISIVATTGILWLTLRRRP